MHTSFAACCSGSVVRSIELVCRLYSDQPMLKFTFTKTGKPTGAFLGDSYKIEYNLSLPDGRHAKVSYRDFNATIEIDDRLILIKPVMKEITVNCYLILEGDVCIGQIKKFSWWNNKLKIVLNAGVIFKAKRVYQNFWDRLFNSNDYLIFLSSENNFVKYTFKANEHFSKSFWTDEYRALEGHVESTIDNMLIPSIGFVLIELMLIDAAS